MSMSEQKSLAAFPLAWPMGWKRTPVAERTFGRFVRREKQPGYGWPSTKSISVSDGVNRILGELERMGIDSQDVIISTNIRLRLDGLPRSGDAEPADPGAALYWRKTGEPMRSMAIDRYKRVADNLGALAATLEAMRAIERHGGAEILERTFTGFLQLEAENKTTSWWALLGVTPEATEAEIQAAYRKKAAAAHPDAPTGSHDAMSALNEARRQALDAAKGRR